MQTEYTKYVLSIPEFNDVYCNGSKVNISNIFNNNASCPFHSMSIFRPTEERLDIPIDSIDNNGNIIFIGMDNGPCSFHLPAIRTANTESPTVSVDMSHQIQNGNGNYEHVLMRDFVYSLPTEVDSSKCVNVELQHGTAVLHFRLKPPVFRRFTKCLVSANKPVIWVSELDMNNGKRFSETGMPYLSLSLNDIIIEKGDSLDLYMSFNSDELNGTAIRVIVLDDTGQTFSTSFSGQPMSNGNIYHFCGELAYDWTYVSIANLPVLSIVTENGKLPEFDIVNPPAGAWGRSICNMTNVKSSMTVLSEADSVIYETGQFKQDSRGLTIRVRGNTSASSGSSYVPFKLHLQKQADLLFRDKGNTDYRDKDWLLLGISMKTMIGYEMNRIVGLEYTPSARLVLLFINGICKGRYLLSESVCRNPECRLNVDRYFGYIIERDPYWWNENLYFNTAKFSNKHYGYTFKYPDSENISERQLTYIKNAVGVMEQSIADGTYEQYIDVGSFAAWLLGHDILGTYDFAGSNMYFTKYDNTDSSKIKMANMWDFDSIERDDMKNEWSKIHSDNDGSYFPALFASESPAFRQAYYDKWMEIRETVYPTIMTLLNGYGKSAEYLAWGQTLTNEIPIAEKWYSERIEWLDKMIGSIAGPD